MIPLSEIPKIISTGKLKTYQQGRSFLEVYYTHSTLPERSFYLFTFTAQKHEFLEAKMVTVSYLPLKYKAKVYGKMIERLMRQLAKEAAEASGSN